MKFTLATTLVVALSSQVLSAVIPFVEPVVSALPPQNWIRETPASFDEKSSKGIGKLKATYENGKLVNQEQLNKFSGNGAGLVAAVEDVEEAARKHNQGAQISTSAAGQSNGDLKQPATRHWSEWYEDEDYFPKTSTGAWQSESAVNALPLNGDTIPNNIVREEPKLEQIKPNNFKKVHIISSKIGRPSTLSNSIKVQHSIKKHSGAELHARGFDPNQSADDKLWDAAQCKGGQLRETMRADDHRAAEIYGEKTLQSQWNDKDFNANMRKWGWSYRKPNQDAICNFDGYKVFKDLGINDVPKDSGGENACFVEEHGTVDFDDPSKPPIRNQRYTVDGKEYKMTGASAIGGINAKGGLMIAINLLSPQNSAERYFRHKPASDELPELRRMSDIFWGYWALDNPDVKNLKYIWVKNVINQGSSKIAARALRNAGKKDISDWPGTSFDCSSDDGQALLGSPNGYTWGHMLEAHKKELGKKWISKVTVFTAEPTVSAKGPYLDLLYWIEDAPPDDDAITNEKSSLDKKNTIPLDTKSAKSLDKISTTSLDKISPESELQIRGFDYYDPADDKLWNDHVCKGGQMIESMKADDDKAAQIWGKQGTLRSEWADQPFVENMKKWGWEMQIPKQDVVCDFSFLPFFEALHLNGHPKQFGGENFCFKAIHGDPRSGTPIRDQRYTVDGKEYRKTGGSYAGAINAKGGLIIAQAVFSPYRTAAGPFGHSPEEHELPALRRLSDIFWGYWTLDNPDITNLKYVMVSQVSNRNSEKLINRAFQKHGDSMPYWPGVVFDMDSEEGKAILGSPNGYTWGHLLEGHKKELGNKRISKVTVFSADEETEGTFEPTVDLLFWVEDAPPE